MTVKLPIDPRRMPDGAILIFHLRYVSTDHDSGETTESSVYQYVLSKVGQSWYGTGTGRVPQAAGWGAVERWLDEPGRKVERVELVTGQRTIWPEPVAAETPDPYDLEHGEV